MIKGLLLYIRRRDFFLSAMLILVITDGCASGLIGHCWPRCGLVALVAVLISVSALLILVKLLGAPNGP